MAADSLTTPLLLPPGLDGGGGCPDRGAAGHGKDGKASVRACTCWPVILVEAKKQLKLAAPMICVSGLQVCMGTISVMFVGHLGELALASASISNSFAVVTGLSVMVGLSSGLETLCGQAFGAKRYRMLGVYLQRGFIIQLLTATVVSVLWLNIASILKWVGQDHEISDKAGEYTAWLVPFIFAHAMLQPMQRFLQTQGIMVPMLINVVVTTVVHVVLCWLLVFVLGVGFRGAAMTTSTSAWINVFLNAFYIKFSPRCSKTWTGFSLGEAWQDKVAFARLAVPATIMVCLEWWSLEFLVILSGLLPNPQLELSALTICINTVYLAFMVPSGLGTAASTRVSNELGAGRPSAARTSASVVLMLAGISALTISSITFSARNVLGTLYSNEEEVIRYVSKMIPFISILTLMDGFSGVLSGIARGCGWQKWGALTNLGAYYIVGLPAAIVLAFGYHLNGRGLWIGLLAGLAVQLCCLSLITFFTNWNQQVENAKLRLCSSVSATLPIHQEQSDQHANGESAIIDR